MAKNIKNWSWEKIGVMLTTAAILITFWQSQMKIMGYLGDVKERIAKIEEFKETVVDKIEDKLNKLEKEVNDQSNRIAWLEGYIKSLHLHLNLVRTEKDNE